jgi:hypothetical protein
MKLTPEEMETAIVQAADDYDHWSVVTSDKSWKSKLIKLGFEPAKVIGTTTWFVIPGNAVVVRKPPAKKNLSDERRAALSARMRKIQATS